MASLLHNNRNNGASIFRRSDLWKISLVFILTILGFYFSSPRHDMTLHYFTRNTENSNENYISPNAQSYFLHRKDDSKDKDNFVWIPTSHYKGSGQLLVDKHIIVKKGDAYPIEQAALARFKEGGHVEFHQHMTGIETFTG
jgi:hypothetical protein